jgi:hypothetical protein
MQLIQKIQIQKTHETGTRTCAKIWFTTRIKIAGSGCVWVAGLLMAGSDSIYMPWLNALGALIFAGISLVLGNLLSCLNQADPDRTARECPGRAMEEKFMGPMKNIHNRKSVTPYAVGAQGRIFSKV